jgi:hypothetical protein
MGSSLTSPQNLCVNAMKLIYCKTYRNFYAWYKLFAIIYRIRGITVQERHGQFPQRGNCHSALGFAPFEMQAFQKTMPAHPPRRFPRR